MNRLHDENGITFTAYNLRLVASAATLVFLNVQHRYAVPRSIFLFHAPLDLAAGAFSAEALRKQADQLDLATQSMRSVLLARTRRTRAQADVYTTRMVALSTDDAQHDGVIDAVQARTVPKNTRVWLIKPKPATPPATIPEERPS